MAQTIVNVEDFGPDGTGVQNSDTALEAALQAAANRVLLFPDASKTYAFAQTLTIPPNTRIINAGAELAPRAAPGTTAIVGGPGLRADLLRIRVGSRSRVSPVLVLDSNTTIERLEIDADRQQANRSWGEFGLYVRGSHINLGYLSVKGFDHAVVVQDAEHVVIHRIEIAKYAKGLFVSRCHFLEVVSGAITAASETALGDRNHHDTVAGLNGLLIEDSSDLVISDLIVHDSIEHGIRIGGGRGTRRCTFSNIQVRRSGGCGMKIQPADEVEVESRGRVRKMEGIIPVGIQINGLMVLDCAPPLDPTDHERKRFVEGSRNRSGLRLERTQNVVVNGLQVGRDAHSWYSAYHGLYIGRCKNVTVNAPQITDTYSAGIVLSDGTGKDEEGKPVKSAAVNEIYVRDPVVTFLVPEAHDANSNPADGILITSPTEILRNVAFTGCYVRGYTGHGVKIQPSSATGVRWPVILQGWVKQEQGARGVFKTTADDPDIHHEDLRAV